MLKRRSNKYYGWHPDLPDFRDFELAEHEAGAPSVLPDHVDLSTSSPGMPPVYDQGQLGSCTANAIAGVLEYAQRKLVSAIGNANKKVQEPEFTPSRLFIYYNERSIEGTTSQDAGAAIRDGIKVVNKLGFCPEKNWPYAVGKFAKKPSVTAFRLASKNLAITYKRVSRSADSMRMVLAGGNPFVAGFSVYSAFESDAVAGSGVLNMPQTGEDLLGGHAIAVVGYDVPSARWIIRNSWGKDWGQQGYFTMPFEYLLTPKLSSDFWVITKVEFNTPTKKATKVI